MPKSSNFSSATARTENLVASSSAVRSAPIRQSDRLPGVLR